MLVAVVVLGCYSLLVLFFTVLDECMQVLHALECADPLWIHQQHVEGRVVTMVFVICLD